MSGIAGFFGNLGNKHDIHRMLARMEHRGPDIKQFCSQGRVIAGVVSHRLSEKCGNGHAGNGNTNVLLDGEVYQDGSPEGSDADTVLRLYKRHGKKFAAYLKGAFACAVVDGDELLLARDPMGMRPMYWGQTGVGNICFASEMKAVPPETDPLFELGPGTLFSSNTGIQKYLPHYPDVPVPGSVNEAKNELRYLVFASVKKRLRDKAVGAVLLSGGLDSSIIAAVANEICPGLPLLSVGMEGAPDLENAKIMARHLGSKHHHVRTYGVDEIKRLMRTAPVVLESFDEDCVNGTIANMVASSFASEQTHCVLSGEGADELFGGYHLLKGLGADSERLDMMDRLIRIAYNTALQRLDRAMMANGVNYRTPFLDTQLATYALQLPVQWKIHASDTGLIEKWILREAFKDMLPDQIYSRQKARFSQGTGTEKAMRTAAQEIFESGDFHEETNTTASGYRLNSPLELYYYKVFRSEFPAACEKLVGRWDPSK